MASSDQDPVSGHNHYSALDGLRGLTAICILLYHLGNGLHLFFIASNSALGVDFFFCLSGFVLDKAYRGRLDGTMSLGKFMRIRLIRLMPLVMLATLVSLAYMALRMAIGADAVPLDTLAIVTVLALLNLPYFGAPRVLGGPQVFPLNGPQYTLLLEVGVNLFWALSPRLRRTDLTVAVMLAALVGIVMLGFGGDKDTTFLAGWPRVTFSFFLGTLVHRITVAMPPPRSNMPFMLASAVMFAMIFWPVHFGSLTHIIFAFTLSPLIVYFGAAVHLPPRADKAAAMLGGLSYPLYILHFPIYMWINGVSQVVLHHRYPLVIIPATLVIGIAASLVIERYVDVPVRKWLSSLGKPPRPVSAPPAVDREASLPVS